MGRLTYDTLRSALVLPQARDEEGRAFMVAVSACGGLRVIREHHEAYRGLFERCLSTARVGARLP